jgi:hypothetical protein
MSTAISTEQVTIEQLDDIPLRVARQSQMGLAETIDAVIPRHWLLSGLSIAQLIVGWNTFILSQADPSLGHCARWGHTTSSDYGGMPCYPYPRDLLNRRSAFASPHSLEQ